MKKTTMNRNNLKDPRHEASNYNTTALPFFFLIKQPFIGNLNIFPLVQLEVHMT